jgi:Dolichyl-phosphate-mannose-protein mannosyltransferase
VSVLSVSVSAARGAGRTLDVLVARPRWVLGTLVAAEIVLTLLLAGAAAHNGWVYYQGGDQIINTTTGWLLGQLKLPPTEVGYFWPLLQAPITWFTGPSFVQAMPAIAVFDVLVLGPVALLAFYALASSVGGRLLGYWAALLWVVAPFVAIPLFDQRYHTRWVAQFLPQALGLTAMPDFLSMVLVLLSALYVVRSLAPERVWDAALAGVLFGAAVGTKPPNILLGVGAALGYLVARRWREAVAFGIGTLPALLLLAFWKYRGLGELPVLAYDQVRLAAGTAPLALDVHRYVDISWSHWRNEMDSLQEYFWSPRIAQWAPFAGLFAVLRLRRFAVAALLAGWLGAFIVFKGFNWRASIDAGSFWRLLMPAWPAYLLLFAAIPFLVPTLARQLGDRIRPPATRPVRPRWVVLAAVVTVGVPAVATAASTRIHPPAPVVVQEFPSGNIQTPVDSSIHVRTQRFGAGQRISWTDGPWRGKVFYKVYRSVHPGPDVQCQSNVGTWSCYLRTEPITTTRSHSYLDPSPPRGSTYRIGVATNWANDTTLGDVFAFSPPAPAAR